MYHFHIFSIIINLGLINLRNYESKNYFIEKRNDIKVKSDSLKLTLHSGPFSQFKKR